MGTFSGNTEYQDMKPAVLLWRMGRAHIMRGCSARAWPSVARRENRSGCILLCEYVPSACPRVALSLPWRVIAWGHDGQARQSDR